MTMSADASRTAIPATGLATNGTWNGFASSAPKKEIVIWVVPVSMSATAINAAIRTRRKFIGSQTYPSYMTCLDLLEFSKSSFQKSDVSVVYDLLGSVGEFGDDDDAVLR